MILYHAYYAFTPFITCIWTTFVKATFSKSIIFKVKSTFERNVFKWVIETIFISSTPLIINVKIFSNFQKEWCTFGRKFFFEKNKHYPLSRFECFEHVKTFFIFVKLWACKFAINGKCLKKTWKSKLLCFPCDISNIQKCNFKECPFTWVAPFIVILPPMFLCTPLHVFWAPKVLLPLFFSPICKSGDAVVEARAPLPKFL